jgi:hypothetical protein
MSHFKDTSFVSEDERVVEYVVDGTNLGHRTFRTMDDVQRELQNATTAYLAKLSTLVVCICNVACYLLAVA